MKDDSDSCAVFTEQGSSASHMTAAKVLDVISSLPGCTGQAADAVSAVHPSKNSIRSKVVGITIIRMSNDLDPSAKQTPPKIMGQCSRSRGTSRKNFVLTSVYVDDMKMVVKERPCETHCAHTT